MEDIEFWIYTVVENSNKLQKIGLKKENELNVFAPGGPTTHATLSIHEIR